MSASRHWFGGGSADYAYALGIVGGVSNVLIAAGGATLNCWSTLVGNNPITDLLVGGQAATSVPLPAGGQIPAFKGPAGTYGLFVSVGGGPRVWLVANDPDGLVADLVENGTLTAAALSATYAPVSEPVGTAAQTAANAAQASANAAIGLAIVMGA